MSKQIGLHHLLYDGGGVSRRDKELLLGRNEAACRGRGRTSEATKGILVCHGGVEENARERERSADNQHFAE